MLSKNSTDSIRQSVSLQGKKSGIIKHIQRLQVPHKSQVSKQYRFGKEFVASAATVQTYKQNDQRFDDIKSSNSKDGPVILNGQPLYKLHNQGKEVVNSMEGFMAKEILPLLNNVDTCWQPADLLPDPVQEDFIDQVKDLRERAKDLPDEYYVVLSGDMITEEALPTYMSQLNTFEGVDDMTGALQTPWAIWTRRWTSEENRHGDAMNKYMYLTGKCDMKNIERTIQRLIGNGMNSGIDTNPYLGFIYTSFQEKATQISHRNTGNLASKYGDRHLGKLCAYISRDEGRHEAAYTKIVRELFQRDPNNTMQAFSHMMRRQIVMPAHFMDDGNHAEDNNGRGLFQDYANVAEKLGVYTAIDYADILDHLIKQWGLQNMKGLSSSGQKEQEYLCNLAGKIRRISERVMDRKKKSGVQVKAKFSWVFNREMQTQ